MRLECPVIRDLYVLYKENELSEEVREAIEKHLETCSECRNIYESEENFSDILKKPVDEQPSKKLDEKMMLRLKVARLKVGVLFVAAIFLVSIYFNYIQSRQNLLQDMSLAEQSIRQLSFNMDHVKTEASVNFSTQDIESINTQNGIIKRNLNFIEKSSLKKAPNELFMDFRVSYLADLLNIRYQKGTFSERDEKAYSLLKKYIDESAQLLERERFSRNYLSLSIMNDVLKLRSLFIPVNIKALTENYATMNQLSLIYYEYGKFPDEISPLTHDELKERIRNVLGVDNLDVRLYSYAERSIRLNGYVEFEATSKDNGFSCYGSIDAYTGIIQEILNHGATNEGELLPLEDIKDNLSDFLNRDFKGYSNFDIQYKGINYHFNSNMDVKMYSFEVYPVIKGYKVNDPFRVYYDARSGTIHNLKFFNNSFTVPDYDVDTSLNITPAEGLINIELEDDNKADYKFKETYVIKSKLTGKYVLVHVYENNTGRIIYVNTSTKKQDFAH